MPSLLLSFARSCQLICAQDSVLQFAIADKGVAQSLKEPLQCQAVAKAPDHETNNTACLFAAATMYIAFLAAASAGHSGHDPNSAGRHC